MPLIVLLALTHAGFTGFRLAISLNALNMQASALTVGVLMSLLMVVPTFTSVPVGRWVDRVGYRKPSLIGLAGLLVGEVFPALVPSFLGLALASVLVGTSFTLIHVSVNNAIGHAAGSHRTRAFGLMGVGFSMSALVGPMVAGLSIDHFGFRWAFVVLSLFAVLPIVVLLRSGPELRPEPREGAESGGVTDLLRLPALRAVLVVSVLVSSGWDLFTFLVPLHGAQNGLSATAIGLVAGGFGVGSALVRLALPWIAARVSEWKLVGGALVLAGFGYFLMPFCTTVGSMVPLALVLGMVLGSGQPVMMSLLHVTAPANRTGEAVGLRSAIISLNQTILPLAFGGFGAAVGMAPLFWVVASLMGVGGGYAVTRKHRHGT